MKHALVPQLGSTLILRIVILLFGALVAFLCLFLLPKGIMSDETGMYRPLLIGMYIPAVPFFIALYQGMKLLHLIDKNKVFSESSVKALRYIQYCGFTIGALYALYMPYIFQVADRDDAPGVALLGFVFVFASFVVGAAAAVFQKLLQNVIDIKSENELTV